MSQYQTIQVRSNIAALSNTLLKASHFRRRCTSKFRHSAPTFQSAYSRTSRSSCSQRRSCSPSTFQRQLLSCAIPHTPRAVLTTSVYRLPKAAVPLREIAVASTASVLAGFGVVALFCSVGVYV